MSVLLCVVEDVFQIGNRGCVVTPGVPPDAGVRPRAGDRVLLKRPDGSELMATLQGMEMGGRAPESPSGTPILLVGVVKKDIPPGTEVWLA
jgi:translation elongation factor EF-Tu-like GTPase